MKKVTCAAILAVFAASCASTYSPVEIGMNQFSALDLCPSDGRVISSLGPYTVLECAYKPNEYAVLRDGEALEVLEPEAYVLRATSIICPTSELPARDCMEAIRAHVSERQSIKETYLANRQREQDQIRSQRMMAFGAALQAAGTSSPPPSNNLPANSLGPSPSMLTGFLVSQYTQGTMRTCIYDVGGQRAQRTIPIIEICPLSW